MSPPVLSTPRTNQPLESTGSLDGDSSYGQNRTTRHRELIVTNVVATGSIEKDVEADPSGSLDEMLVPPRTRERSADAWTGISEARTLGIEPWEGSAISRPSEDPMVSMWVADNDP